MTVMLLRCRGTESPCNLAALVPPQGILLRGTGGAVWLTPQSDEPLTDHPEVTGERLTVKVELL